MFSSRELAVLHLALNPVTGVWSVMKNLAKAQNEAGLYAATAVGVIADKKWPDSCSSELHLLGSPYYQARTAIAFGTAQFLWQRVHRPPLDRWVEDLLTKSGAKHCIVHFHNAWLSGVFLPLSTVRRGRTRVIATFHGVNGHFRRQPVRQKVHQWMANRLVTHGARLTSVDKANLSRANHLLKLQPESFRVIPNGVSDTKSRGCPYLDGGHDFTVGHVGSIVPQKGWRILVEAAQKLRKEGLPIKVVLAGRGEDAEEARKLAEASGGWLTYEGFVTNPRESIMTRLDSLVLMSEQEGLPMAIIEALSVGVPIIGTPVGGIPEAVLDAKNGFLLPRSVDALTDTLRRLARDRDLQSSLSRGARCSFEDCFEISKIVSRYHSLYEERV